MAHVSYPESFPLECVSDLIQIGRGGMEEILARKSEVGLHFWNVQGFAQKAILGDPDNPIFGSADDEADAAEQVAEFVSVYSSACGKPETFAADFGRERRIDWLKLIAFLKEIAPIILPLLI